MAADFAANRLRALGGAIRDGAIDYRNFYTRELPEMVRGAFSRGAAPPPQDFAEASQALQGAEAMAGAEEAGFAAAEAGGLAVGAMEGAELGALGGPLGVLAGAALGGVAGETASLMFRNRQAPQQQSTFLDARSLNNQNQSVRPLQPRLNRFQEGGASSSGDSPQFYNIGSREPSRDVMRPSAAPTPKVRERSAQSVIDETAEPMMVKDRVRLYQRNMAPPSQAIRGEPNPGMLADRAPKDSYRDIMQATAAPAQAPRRNKRIGGYSGSPYAFPMSGAPSIPAPPRPYSREPPAPKAAPQQRNRRNKGPPKKDDQSKR
jgi:hypothetical protein